VQAFVDDIVRVSDEAIFDATRRLLTASKLVVEFSGAATVAALLSGAVRPAGRTVAVLSGGNLDPARYADLLAAAPPQR
jgi:threonine dehydratase